MKGLDINGVFALSSHVLALAMALTAFVVLVCLGHAAEAKGYIVPIMMVVIGAFGVNAAHMQRSGEKPTNNNDPASKNKGA